MSERKPTFVEAFLAALVMRTEGGGSTWDEVCDLTMDLMRGDSEQSQALRDAIQTADGSLLSTLIASEAKLDRAIAERDEWMRRAKAARSAANDLIAVGHRWLGGDIDVTAAAMSAAMTEFIIANHNAALADRPII